MEGKLSQLLVAQDSTERQLLALDESVTSLSQKIFSTENQSENLHLLLRLSVTEGVQDMYTQFNKKLQEKMLQCSLSEGNDSLMDMSTVVRSSFTRGGNTKTDKAADVWTTVYCEFYRGS